MMSQQSPCHVGYLSGCLLVPVAGHNTANNNHVQLCAYSFSTRPSARQHVMQVFFFDSDLEGGKAQLSCLSSVIERVVYHILG